MNKNGRHLNNERGFSLVEIMVVLIIIGMILGFAGTKFMSRLERAKVQGTEIQMKIIQQALASYRLDNGRYPTTAQGLSALITKPGTPPEPKNYDPEGYLDLKGEDVESPLDKWDNEIVYESETGASYKITSLGADNSPGGEDNNKDIIYEN